MYIDGVSKSQKKNACQLVRKQSERPWSSCHCVRKLHSVMNPLHFLLYIITMSLTEKVPGMLRSIYTVSNTGLLLFSAGV
jgi:hypothetical protein